MKKILILLIVICLSTCVFGEEVVKVRLSDGESIAGQLKLPQGNKVPLLVVFVHGTGPNTYLNKRKMGIQSLTILICLPTNLTKEELGFFPITEEG